VTDHKKEGIVMIYKLYPVFKDYLWGGTRLRDEYGKACDYDKVAESWELSCHPDGVSMIAPAGADTPPVPLTDFIRTVGRKELLGSKPAAFPSFPVMIKLIDAKDNLSVQVHPDDHYARRVENSDGKTEMWVVVDCEEGAELLYGFNRPVTREEVETAARNDTLLELANHVPVHKGDVFWINAGTLHAIGKGILIAEIQQNSNITYRLYDYGRVDKDGNKRPLHLDKALDVLRLEKPSRMGPIGRREPHIGYTRLLLGSCHYFTVFQIDLRQEYTGFATPVSFHCLTVTEGILSIENEGCRVDARKGDSFLIPAGAGAYTLRGQGKVLITTV
jgi:mannose-6-phosphate isomerase